MPRKKSNKNNKNNGIYFNKNDMYKSGIFKSVKNRQYMKYRSAYEYAFFEKLESDPNVIKYLAEAIHIPYVDIDLKKRTYIPDVLVLYKDGRMELCEVKPTIMLKDQNVQLKARAAIRKIKSTGKNMSFRFVTENDLFKSNKEYLAILDKIK